MRDFAVRLDHRPGELARVAAVLSHYRVNLTSVAGVAIGNRVIIRLIPDDVDATRDALEAADIAFQESEAIRVVLAHRPGELAVVTSQLAEGGINLRAIYLTRVTGGLVELAIVPDNVEHARRLLRAARLDIEVMR
jgi:hypothetical protein